MSRSARLSALMLVALALPLAAFAQERKPDELLFGSVAMDIPAVMYQRLKPLTDYLASELKRPVRLKLAPDMSKAISDVATGSVDIAYLTPVAYIKAQKAGQVRLVAKTITKGEESFRLMVVVRHDSPIKQVKDLAGKSFAFGDEAAILQRAVVVNAGVPIEQLGSYKYLGHYDNIARGVANGDFDAGILKDTTAFQWEKKGLRILHTSPALPPYNIAVSSRVDDATLRALQDALVKLNPANPENLRIIKVLDQSYDGFAATHDAEYDVVRQLIKPFQK